MGSDKRRVRVKYAERLAGGRASVQSVILAGEYDKDLTGDALDEIVREDFWSLPIWQKALTEKIEIKEIATV